MNRPKIARESDRAFLLRHAGVASLLVFAVVTNFLLSLFFMLGASNSPSGIPVYITMGFIAAQLVAFGFFFVMFPADFIFRFFATFGLVVLLYSSLVFSSVVFDSHDVGVLIEQLPVLPALVLATATPFAIGRAFLGWRLGFDEGVDCDSSWRHFEASSTGSEQSLTIASILVVTALVAMAMVSLQAGSEIELRIRLVAAMICMGVSLIVFLPFAFKVMRTKNHWLWVCGVGLVSFWCCYFVLEVLRFVPGAGMLPPWAQIGFSLSVSSCVFFFGLFLITLKMSNGKLRLVHRDAPVPDKPFTNVPLKKIDPLA